jgi:hypothetical protein
MALMFLRSLSPVVDVSYRHTSFYLTYPYLQSRTISPLSNPKEYRSLAVKVFQFDSSSDSE